MNFADILDRLEELLPILATATGHPEIGVLASRLLNLGEEEWARRSAASGRTRREELADAAATYQTFKTENAALKKMGHEND